MPDEFLIPIEPLILASRSPRRKQLLQCTGLQFRVLVPDVREPPPDLFPDPYDYVLDVAWRKAQAATRQVEVGTVLAADTVTSVAGFILGKPADETHARKILQSLSGTRHSVLTAVCISVVPDHVWLGAVAESIVEMRRLTEQEIDQYIATGQWQDKAGAYAIQDNDPFVSLISGELDTVVGLPLKLVARLLKAACALGLSRE